MTVIKRSELRGILILGLIILFIGALLAVSTGKLETWFGITIGGGPRLFDKIVFVSGNELYTMNPDGSDVKQLTTGGCVLSGPFVSPNGSRVVFVGRAENSNQVLLVHSGGGEPVALTSVTGGKQEPQFSPDGQQLAFISGGTVYAGDQDADGLHPVLPTEEETHEAMARREPLPAYKYFAWSPNGEGIAGVREDREGHDILVILPKIGGKAAGIALSPGVTIQGICYGKEGDAVVFSVKNGAKGSVAQFDPASRQTRILASLGKVLCGSPAISPDGTRVAVPYVASESDSGILEINVESGEVTKMAKGHLDKPQYSPDGKKLLALTGSGGVALVDTTSGELTEPIKGRTISAAVWSPATPK